VRQAEGVVVLLPFLAFWGMFVFKEGDGVAQQSCIAQPCFPTGFVPPIVADREVLSREPTAQHAETR